MNKEDLAFVAEALLALCERDRAAPHYSEAGFEAKLRSATRREAKFAHVAMGRGSHPMLQSECEDVIAAADLTDRQRDVLMQRLEGRTFEEIGHAGGHTKQGAQSIFVQGLKKLMRAYDVYAYRGLCDVYRDEVRRGTRSRKVVVGRVGRI